MAGPHEEQPQAGASDKREAASETDRTPRKTKGGMQCDMCDELWRGLYVEKRERGRLRGSACDGAHDENEGRMGRRARLRMKAKS